MTTHTSPTGRILVGIDGSAASIPAVRWAAREAQLRGMRVHVLYVRDQRVPTLAHYAPRPRVGDSGAGWAVGETTMKTVVKEALGAESSPGVQMELADGLPARVLLDRAVGAEMLVLGSGGPSATQTGGPQPAGAPSGIRPGVSPVPARTPLGPVARDCLHAAPCPVVVVRPSSVTAPGEPVPVRLPNPSRRPGQRPAGARRGRQGSASLRNTWRTRTRRTLADADPPSGARD
jgi:nucleotide-binding universal stress UspA family protein